MTVGVKDVLANAILNHLRGGATWTAPATLAAQIHTGDPGAAGTTLLSQHTVRHTLGFAAAAGGAIAQTGTTPEWVLASLTAPTSETISHYSVWDNITAGAGAFLWSVLCAATKTVSNTDHLQLATYGLGITPLAA